MRSFSIAGAPTGLITSDGFRDLLEIGRQKRPELYDLQADKPPSLVERRLRLEVPERLRYDGRVETALGEAAVQSAVRVLRDAGVEAIAVCFLYSFVDPAHETAACRIDGDGRRVPIPAVRDNRWDRLSWVGSRHSVQRQIRAEAGPRVRLSSIISSTADLLWDGLAR
jgi:hypothetical protein